MGSNQGRTREQLERAVDALADLLEGLRLGPLYRSPPEDDRPAPPYLNTAVVGYSSLAPEALLAALKRIEYRAGRRPAERHAPRPLDLDLLLYGALSSDRPELTLPHPRLRRRTFVLEPLAKLTPDWPVPPDGEPVVTLARRAGHDSHLERLAWGDLGSLADRGVTLPPGSR
ncbi:MAG: 2-amino-4-hydroxy-6-hydroxymethyldihydropteridine diphosphokinase [Thermoanaerobaculia bacterium]|nr:2-amino-4-hydroxy-6-hydroxymethyldihydropteridine diphosphokinase [Thermoanaerobaculia bacterium]